MMTWLDRSIRSLNNSFRIGHEDIDVLKKPRQMVAEGTIRDNDHVCQKANRGSLRFLQGLRNFHSFQ